ncbi:MAG: ATP-dependent helicase, partial [Pseudomonadota bacterium]|nr:ATP-dependent helicase [Pseudomonadota bacterium]
MDYSDLTLGALRLFQQQPQVLRAYRAQFDHILVDELQDSSTVQYAWLRRLAGGWGGSVGGSHTGSGVRGGTIFCAADDDQSIYGWRGAERSNVLRFQQEFPELEVIRLTRSYRCSPHVLGSAQALLAHAGESVPKTCYSQRGGEGAPRVLLRGFWDSHE